MSERRADVSTDRPGRVRELVRRVGPGVAAIVAVVAIVVGLNLGFGDRHGASSDAGGVSASAVPASTGTALPPNSPGGTSAPSTTPLGSPASSPPPSTPVDVSSIDLVVLDSTGTDGLSTRMTRYLEAKGWFLRAPGTYSPVLATTTIFCPPGFESVASALAPLVPGPDDTQVQPDPPGSEADVLTLVLGTDASSWSAPE